jgi:hypothetical protein
MQKLMDYVDSIQSLREAFELELTYGYWGASDNKPGSLCVSVSSGSIAHPEVIG